MRNVFRLSNPLDDDEFFSAVLKLHEAYEAAKFKNYNNHYKRYPAISREAYIANGKKILVEYFAAKDDLYEERSKAQFTTKVFSNGTDPVAFAVRDLIKVLERYEVEILEDNQQMNDEIAENMRNITETVKVYILCHVDF